jgi:pSer/pThr/pTyr-binding forkhead associated (FHA) protein
MFQIVVHDSDGRRTVQKFDQDEISVGRAPDNDVVLADASVSKHHARLSRHDNGFRVQDLGSTNGVYVSGIQALGGAEVSAGERVGVGDFTLTIAPLVEQPADAFRIGITAPSGEHHVFTLAGDDATLGASPDCDLQLEGDGVSPRHCRIVVKNERIVLADLKSSTGTHLNDERLKAPQVVQPGDVARVGCFAVTFAHPGEPGPLFAEPAPSAEGERTVPTAEPEEESERSGSTSAEVTLDDHPKEPTLDDKPKVATQDEKPHVDE